MPVHKALVIPEKRVPYVVKSVPTPKPEPAQVLIKVESVSLAPFDWAVQSLGMVIEEYPAILGEDIAGTVVEVGEGVTRFKIGERVLRQAALSAEYGGFQHYALGDEDTTAEIPSNMTFDQAATIPLALATSSVALYHSGENANGETFGLTPPWEEGGSGKYAGQPAVILGGAGSVGQKAIELLRLSGFNPIITTASPRNTDFLLKTVGATHVLDRSLSPDTLQAEIRKIAEKPIKTVYDAVGTPETQTLGYDLLAPGGVLAYVQPQPIPPEKLVPDKKAFFVFGDLSIPRNRKLGVSLYSKLTELLATGALKPTPVEVLPGGLEAVPAGLERLHKGISCLKLIVHPQETQ